MRVVFMGTPDFAVPSLKKLIEEHQVIGVFTREDKPKGRGQKLQYTPVKEAALEAGIQVFQPKRLKNNNEALERLKELSPDVIVVAAYGMLLPKEILDLPQYGCINVHASLLPDLRGAAPINWAIIRGLKNTGITTMLMGEGLDTGDILLKETMPIGEKETAGELFDRLSLLGPKVLIKTLELLEKGQIVPQPQNEAEASYAPMLKKELGHINWSMESSQIYNLIRGVSPWPGAFCSYEGKILKILDAEFDDNCNSNHPGRIEKVTKNSIEVCCLKGNLILKRIQELGGKKMDISAYLNGHTIIEGYYFK